MCTLVFFKVTIERLVVAYKRTRGAIAQRETPKRWDTLVSISVFGRNSDSDSGRVHLLGELGRGIGHCGTRSTITLHKVQRNVK